MSKTMILKPRMSEKAYALSQLHNTYVFEVPADANKVTVAEAVTAQFDVTVVKVNIANTDGKVKRSYRKNGRGSTGRDQDVNKAYVTLKSGDSLPFFASEDDSSKSEAGQRPAKKEGK